MKAILATALTAATMLATPALAASQVHHTSQARAQYNTERGVRPSDAVVSANRVLGQDPDPNIRTQLIHEGEVSAN